jgi:hypothetical protein
VDDAELIARSVAEGRWFELVFDRHYARIHRFCVARAGPDVADDLASETFVVAFRRRAAYDISHADAAPWLYGIALNVLRAFDCALGDQVPKTWLAQIQARAQALNAVEAEVCSTVPYCLYDGGTYYRLPLRAAYFSPADYQHLSIAGQRALAAAEWKIALKVLYD